MKYKTESQLQAAIVMDFSQQRPDEKGLLWATMNRTLSQRDGQKQKAMGLVKGVSDLIYFKDSLVAIEIKLPGAKHSKKHIKEQLEWGKKIEEAGGEYYIVTSLESFWYAIEGLWMEAYTTQDIKTMLEKNGSTISF